MMMHHPKSAKRSRTQGKNWVFLGELRDEVQEVHVLAQKVHFLESCTAQKSILAMGLTLRAWPFDIVMVGVLLVCSCVGT